ncbi:MAG: hypothetical protein A3C85_02195 [Candidatus Doudnabacteria bacterium RIFCSPHIGHO2_02_FULL_48_21]|uniref:Large ribosomal subunit protein bL25 n=1 Tax=Candidatus Doudnabacteria bacterium RIFCSPLOWO2_02_FULL_48_13 TaxID=1817845 RepID=A0A1F5QAT5_9BACT|nr:MAG: hypothetical protein A3K05_02485 [Candidatus Doudnabacteria bacterium RIFCSPHIGHO2_01_48_18]OGE78446.1 MAG: hypothetical protein A2668_04490 [Candidatus Doudnabacteria bacterium RIFCSPHIGHO2_01_FULL_48_180]OGE91700.1 MAG: hypothetical protein A3F44_01520 [Candidatus Doudnabacteria bacterium RIFCSPHIGHO2_12_FULL_47_25]OGE93437.1 MAG: hypothetical protein A3C85_02195 [Candidatus Doudnabacteria bacterium RIFCSPHIGHO2_02_FULL_48_21]OGE97842.1 MAG: hypothetical protein A3A83_03755 [Candidatu
MEYAIQAQARTVLGKQNSKLRKQGIIPAILYGRGKQSQAIQVSSKQFDKIYRQAGENTLVNLKIDGGKETKVLIHDVAKHYMKNEAVHVDFYEVDLTKKIHAKVPLEFVGLAPAVKELGGIFMKIVTEVEVESLPSDLPHKIEINVESLKTFEDAIRISDIKVKGDVKILGNAEDMIASVQAPRTEEELASLEQSTAEAEKAAVEALTKEPEAAAGEEGAEDAEKPEPKKE